MEFIEEVVEGLENKQLIFWGAGRRIRHFLQEFCIEKKILPMPDYICDSTRVLKESTLYGIPVISFDEVKKKNYQETVIIITAGLMDLQAKVVSNELYYFPLYHCRSFQVYYYLKENQKNYEKVLKLLADDKSRHLYREIFKNIINGSFWCQSIYENNPYFGNDIIGNLKKKDVIAFAGAFNGKHIDRMLANNNQVVIRAFEPNAQWYEYLVKKYDKNSKIKIYDKVLWDKKENLRFDQDISNLGLDAHVCKTSDNKFYNFVESIDLDSITDSHRISQIILDVEGSEAKALKGAAKIIENNRPRLSICLYHNIQDFIELPLLIHEMTDGNYQMFVKQHSCITAIETVLYAL